MNSAKPTGRVRWRLTCCAALIVHFLIFLALPAIVQAAEVRIEKARQEGNRVLFEYDLEGDRETEVTVKVTVKGKEYSGKNLHLEGDVGKVKPGKGKRIWWNVLQDFPRGLVGEWEAEVRAGLGPAFKDPVTGMEFIFVKGGCYQMGDTFGDGSADEKPVHEVCLSDFYIGKYEVTQGEWEKVMSDNPSGFKKGDNYPVESLSWDDTQDFINKFARQSGKKYRLPTEAEWEYAARSGGKREKYAGTSDESKLVTIAWYVGNSKRSTHPVGEKKPNGLGLHDMTGNVWEWTADWYGENYYETSLGNNPLGPLGGGMRVHRGGSWYNKPRSGRASSRGADEPGFRNDTLGFRVVLSP